MNRVSRLAIIAIALCSSVPTIALAQEEVAGNGTNQAAGYATRFNVSADEASRRLVIQREVSRLNQKLKAQNGGSFGGLYVDNEPTFQVVVKFKGEGGLSTVQGLISNADLIKVLKIEPTTESLTELAARQKTLLASTKLIGLVAESGIDVRSGVVKFYVLNRAEALAKFVAGSIALNDNVVVEQIPSFIKTTATVYGGYYLSMSIPGSTDTENCTAGFNVTNGTIKGVLTAGHCPDTAKYFSSRSSTYSSTGGTALTFQKQDVNGADLQWHSASGSTFPASFYDGSAITKVTVAHGLNYGYVGEWLCKYGRTTQQTCGTIQDMNYWDPNYGAYFVRVSNSGTMSLEGDSGGPVFLGTEAYGLVHGRNSVNDLFYAEFAFALLNVSVLTQP